jgi:hypothetical protein
MNRRIEPALYFVAQVLLLVSLVGTLFTLTLTLAAGKYIELEATFIPQKTIWTAMMDQYRGRTNDILCYPPPSDQNHLQGWADSIQHHTIFPTAVFLWKDTSIQFVALPPHLKPWTDDLPRVISMSTPRGERIKPDTLGSTIRWNGDARVVNPRATPATIQDHSEEPYFHAHIKAFQRLGETQAWGILYRFDDARRELGNELLAYSPKDMLKSQQWVSGPWNGPSLNFRMFNGDTMLAQTPHLDTLHSKYSEKSKGVRFEYYLDDLMQHDVNLLRHPRLLYFLIFVEISIIGALFFFHRGFKELVADNNSEMK